MTGIGSSRISNAKPDGSFLQKMKIRIVLAGFCGEDSIAELCCQEGIAQSQYYSWSKEFMEAGKKRLAGDTMREANSDQVKGLRKEARDLKRGCG